MSFVRDLFKKIRSKSDSPFQVKKTVLKGDFHDVENIDDFMLYLSLASFTDKGMEIKAQSESTRKEFPERLLNFIANYSAIFIQQVEGEHLFGPFPLPKTQGFTNKNNEEIPYQDWYMLVHVFRSKDESVRDERISSQGSVVASLFLAIYPRKFETLVTHAKGMIKTKFSSASGIAQDINNFTDKKVSLLEKEIINEVQNLSVESQSDVDVTSQIQRYLEHQLLTISEKVESIYSLAKASFRFIDKQVKSSVSIVLVGTLFDLITALQYHIPPIKDLRNIKWRVYQSESEIVKMQIGKVILWFVTPSKLDYFARNANLNRTEIIGIYYGSDINESVKELTILNRMEENLHKVFHPILLKHSKEKSKNIQTLLNKKHKGLVKQLKMNIISFPEEVDGSILSEISWFYDKIVGVLTEFNQSKQLELVDKNHLIKKSERVGLSNLFHKSIGEEEK